MHRLRYAGGRWAYASALLDGFSDFILITIDMADPTSRCCRKSGCPGMNVAAGEVANWPSEIGRFGLHHPIVHGDMAYVQLARRISRSGRCQRPSCHEAHHTQDLGAPFWRRHAQRVAVDKARTSHRGGQAVLDNHEEAKSQSGCSTTSVKSDPISIATFPEPNDADYLKVGGPSDVTCMKTSLTSSSVRN